MRDKRGNLQTHFRLPAFNRRANRRRPDDRRKHRNYQRFAPDFAMGRDLSDGQSDRTVDTNPLILTEGPEPSRTSLDLPFKLLIV